MNSSASSTLLSQAPAALVQEIFNTALIGISVFQVVRDADGVITDFRLMLLNETGSRISGVKAEDIVGKTLRQIYPMTEQHGLFHELVRVCQSGQPIEAERYYPDRQSWYIVTMRLVGEGVMLTYMDITARKKLELDYQVQVELLQTVINNSPTGIVLFEAVRNSEGQIIDFLHRLTNPINNAVTGRSSDQLLGLRMLELFPVNRENGHLDTLIRVMETGQTERRLLHYNTHGINGWFDTVYVKQGDSVLCTYLDVSESQQYRQQLEAVNAELLHSNENLQSFAYIASHDLQEPLRKIQSFGSLLMDQYGPLLSGQGSDYIRRMEVAAERMSRLIRDLLTYSRLTTQREPHRPVSLDEVLQRVMNDLEISLTETNAEIQIENLPNLPGDRTQLGQLFQNLLGNALKFRHPGQRPQIRISARKHLRSEILAGVLPASTNNERPYWAIRVQDNGIGFEPRHTDRIFGVFQRLHGKDQYAGTGVGLAIVKRIADNHAGGIQAEGIPGKGAIFTVYLPA